MDPIEELTAEHRAVEQALNILEAAVDRVSVAESDIRPLDRLFEFFTVFVDRCHHGKEERHLFPAVKASAKPVPEEMIVQLLDEHEEGRALVAEMKQAVAAVREKDINAQQRLEKAAADYTGLLRRHIEKEDERLFAGAAEALSSERKTRLVEQFDKIETEEVGPGRHEEFHRMLDELAERFGG